MCPAHCRAKEESHHVTLPRAVDADKAETSFEDGVLTLTLPKTPDARPKQIKVEATKQISANPAS